MKHTKIIVLILIFAIVFYINSIFAITDDKGKLYPLLTIVVEKDNKMIICEDKEGNLWTFYDDSDTWSIGDIANLLMLNTCNNMEEDEIIEAYWEGYIENIEMFFQIN